MSQKQDALIIEIKKQEKQYQTYIDNKKYKEAKTILKSIINNKYDLAMITNSYDLKKKRELEADELKRLYLNFEAKYPFSDSSKGSTQTQNRENNNFEADMNGDGDTPSVLSQAPHEDVTFDDIIGADKAKKAIHSAVKRIKNYKIFSKVKANPNFGILLYGEPGTGKTMFAKAVATELKLPFFLMNTEDIKDKYVGESEKNVKAAFEQLRQYESVVLYCDEAEVLFGKRGSGENAKLDNSILTSLLKELDGFKKSDTHIILIASTNYPEKIDSAAYSRFEIKVRVGLPTKEAREAILKKHMPHLKDDITYDEIARKTERYSGRNLVSLSVTAFERAFDDYSLDHEVENNEEVFDQIFISRDNVKEAFSLVGPDTTKEQIMFYDMYERKFEANKENDNDFDDNNEDDNKPSDKNEPKPSAPQKREKPNFSVKLDKPFVPFNLDELSEVNSSFDEKKYLQFVEETPQIIENTLLEFGIKVKFAEYEQNMAFTRFAFSISKGTAVSTLTKYQSDIERALKGKKIRILPTIKDKPYIGFEVENPEFSMVTLKSFWQKADKEEKPNGLLFPIGISSDGLIYQRQNDLIHMLIAGAAGMGKSVFLNSIITRLIARYSPEELRLVLIDPKRVEFSFFAKAPQVYNHIYNEVDDAKEVLEDIYEEMERRYKLLESNTYRNIEDYNNDNEEKIPYILVFVDEYADLSATDKEIENLLVLLLNKGRAAGIKMIVATQRVSVDVISGKAKANFSTRIAFRVPSGVDSRVILDETGAEDLVGKGDLLFKSSFDNIRAQGVYISDSEIKQVVKFIVDNN